MREERQKGKKKQKKLQGEDREEIDHKKESQKHAHARHTRLLCVFYQGILKDFKYPFIYLKKNDEAYT